MSKYLWIFWRWSLCGQRMKKLVHKLNCAKIDFISHRDGVIFGVCVSDQAWGARMYSEDQKYIIKKGNPIGSNSDLKYQVVLLIFFNLERNLEIYPSPTFSKSESWVLRDKLTCLRFTSAHLTWNSVLSQPYKALHTIILQNNRRYLLCCGLQCAIK